MTPEEKSAYFREMGRKGGKSVVNRRGFHNNPELARKAALKSAESRRRKKEELERGQASNDQPR